MARTQLFAGICQTCNFRGILQKRVMAETDAIQGTASDEAQTLLVCLTCFETPMGCQSENLKHRRLPEGEYRQ